MILAIGHLGDHSRNCLDEANVRRTAAPTPNVFVGVLTLKDRPHRDGVMHSSRKEQISAEPT
jgi:hypothetical protein